MDDVSGRLNKEGRGKALGAFDTGDLILAIFKNGAYELREVEDILRYEVNDILIIQKFNPKDPISAIYYEGEKGWTMVKRFLIETSTLATKFNFISESKGSKLYYVSDHPEASLTYAYMKNKEKIEERLKLSDFIDVKGWRALGNKLGEFKIITSKDTSPEIVKEIEEPVEENKEETIQTDLFGAPPSKDEIAKKSSDKPDTGLSTGDTIEFDV